MKFQTIQAFDKQVVSSLAHRPSRVYLALGLSSFENGLINKRILQLLQLESCSDITLFDCQVDTLTSLVDALETPTLFSDTRVIVCQNLDKLSKSDKALPRLKRLIERPVEKTFLLLSGAASPLCSTLYEEGKKEIICLDLSAEKTWEKEKRLTELLQEKAAKEGKKVAAPVIRYLFECVGDDCATLFQELTKLLTFTADKADISLDDAKAICHPHLETTGWQLSEALVWHTGKVAEFKGDLSDLIGLIGQCRYHLHIGFALSSRPGRQGDTLIACFPDIKPYVVQKYYGLACKRGFSYFRKALLDLFEVEKLAKMGSVKAPILWEKLVSHLGGKDALSIA